MTVLNQLKNFKEEFEYVFKYTKQNISLFMMKGLNSLKDSNFFEYIQNEILRPIINERRVTSSDSVIGRTYVKTTPGASFAPVFEKTNEERKDV